MSADFTISEYEWAHGRKPRGFGQWAFTPADGIYPGECPEDGIAWQFGMFSEAKRDVAKRFPSVGFWRVLP